MNKYIKRLIGNTEVYIKLRSTYHSIWDRKQGLHEAEKSFAEQYYTSGQHMPASPTGEKTVIAMFDGRRLHGGLSDRLMGIMSVYMLCKQYGIRFKIYFRHPFDLSIYLAPNNYDWTIADDEMVFDTAVSEPVILSAMRQYGNEKKFQINYLTERILHSDKQQLHVYTNASFCMKPEVYSKLFAELFVPSDYLQNGLNHFQQQLSQGYIDATFRFQNLLGDFDEMKIKPLSEEQQNELIQKCMGQIKALYEKKRQTILVTADSLKFLEVANKEPFVFANIGKMVHVDYSDNRDANVHLKSFVDFLLIAHAKEIFSFKTGKMYKSGFPKSASLVYNVPFHHIEF